MNDIAPIVAFSLPIAAQFLVVLYCVHRYRNRSKQKLEDWIPRQLRDDGDARPIDPLIKPQHKYRSLA